MGAAEGGVLLRRGLLEVCVFGFVLSANWECNVDNLNYVPVIMFPAGCLLPPRASASPVRGQKPKSSESIGTMRYRMG